MFKFQLLQFESFLFYSGMESLFYAPIIIYS